MFKKNSNSFYSNSNDMIFSNFISFSRILHNFLCKNLMVFIIFLRCFVNAINSKPFTKLPTFSDDCQLLNV